MTKTDSESNDELREEYNLRFLLVRELGPGRESFATTIRSQPDARTMVARKEAPQDIPGPNHSGDTELPS